MLGLLVVFDGLQAKNEIVDKIVYNNINIVRINLSQKIESISFWFFFISLYIRYMNKVKKLKKIIAPLTEHVWIIDEYLFQVAKLEKKDKNFIISDLDDTLFSRAEQLEKEPELVLRRWYMWNTYLINEIGMPSMIKKYYTNKSYPRDIVDTFTTHESLILTAGIYEYQIGKQKALWLTDFPIKIVSEWKDKILELIRYVIYTLEYVPSEVTVYEDRPQFFIEYRTFIEECLGTKLNVYLVEMDGNDEYKKIELMS